MEGILYQVKSNYSRRTREMKERKLEKDGCNFYSIMQKRTLNQALEVTFPKVKRIRSYVARKYLYKL